MGYLGNGGHKRNKISHKGSLGDEDDAQTLNACIAQRKHAIQPKCKQSDLFCAKRNLHWD